MTRRIAVLFCCLSFFCASCADAASPASPVPPGEPPSSGEAASSPDAAPEEMLSDLAGRYGRGFLTPDEQAVYDDFCRWVVTAAPGDTLEIPAGFTADRVATLLGYVIDDNPALYWMRPYSLVDAARGVHAISFDIAEHLTADDLRRRGPELEEAAASLLGELPQDPFDRVIEIHDRLVRHTGYNAYNRHGDMANLYGALVSRTGVCDAYSKAMQFLLQREGFPCIYIRGTNSRGVPHSWNAVEIDGSWYFLDATWDDREGGRHDYLLIDHDEIGREHIWDTSQYPDLPASPRGQDYFVRKGYVVRPANSESTMEQLARAYGTQLGERAPHSDNPVYLEVKVLGSDAQFVEVKDLFFGNVFEVTRRMEAYLPDGVGLAHMESVECNFNREMRILTFFPSAETG